MAGRRARCRARAAAAPQCRARRAVPWGGLSRREPAAPIDRVGATHRARRRSADRRAFSRGGVALRLYIAAAARSLGLDRARPMRVGVRLVGGGRKLQGRPHACRGGRADPGRSCRGVWERGVDGSWLHEHPDRRTAARPGVDGAAIPRAAALGIWCVRTLRRGGHMKSKPPKPPLPKIPVPPKPEPPEPWEPAKIPRSPEPPKPPIPKF